MHRKIKGQQIIHHPGRPLFVSQKPKILHQSKETVNPSADMTVYDQEEKTGTQAEETTSTLQVQHRLSQMLPKNNAAPEPKPFRRPERLSKAPLKLKGFVVTKK